MKPISAGALIAVVAAALARWLLLGSDVCAVLSSDSASYVGYAVTWRMLGGLPPAGLRLPGYPLFLILTARPDSDYGFTVLIQQVLGCLSTLLWYTTAVRLSGRTTIGLIVVALQVLLVDVVLMETVVYSETLAAFFLAAGACAMSFGLTSLHRRTGWLAASGIAWTAATFTRPVYIAAIAGFAAVLLVAASRRRLAWRTVVAAVAPAVVLIVAFAGYQGSRNAGRPRFVTGVGLSLMNYAAYPEMYRAMPSDMAGIQSIYLAKAPSVPLGYVWWWHVIDPVAVLYAEEGREARSREDVALDVALRTIRARPGIYLAIWSRALTRLLFDYELLHGLLLDDQRAAEPDNLQVSPGRYRVARWLERSWTWGMPVVSLAALILPPLVRVRKPSTSSAAVAALWTVLVATIVVSVSVEPFSRQSRYRIPIEPGLIVLALTSASAISRARGTIPL